MAESLSQYLETDRRRFEEQLALEESGKEQAQILGGGAPLSEAECAIAWAEALQEVVSVLELQLEDTETELQKFKLENEVLREAHKMSPPPTPGRSNGGSSLKSLVDQLQASQNEEARRHDKEKSVQQQLAQAKEEAMHYRTELQRMNEEAARLRADLQVERSHTQQMIAQTSELQGLWGQYTSSQQVLEDQLQEMTRREAEQRAHVAELQRLIKEAQTPQDDDRVQWLEQAVAEAQAKAIEERNQAAKLGDENQALHMELKRMQQLLGANGWSASTGCDPGMLGGYSDQDMDRGSLDVDRITLLRETCTALAELRDVLLNMSNIEGDHKTSPGVLRADSQGTQNWGELTVPKDILSHGIKATTACVEQLGHLASIEDARLRKIRDRHSFPSNGNASRPIETWAN